jgi:hypothetical protein
MHFIRPYSYAWCQMRITHLAQKVLVNSADEDEAGIEIGWSWELGPLWTDLEEVRHEIELKGLDLLWRQALLLQPLLARNRIKQGVQLLRQSIKKRELVTARDQGGGGGGGPGENKKKGLP